MLTIADREHRIANGECLLNESDEVRIAPLLDVWRRGMPIDMELLSRLLAAIVRIVMKYRGVSYGAESSEILDASPHLVATNP